MNIKFIGLEMKIDSIDLHTTFLYTTYSTFLYLLLYIA
jgi:hypothetical protein